MTLRFVVCLFNANAESWRECCTGDVSGKLFMNLSKQIKRLHNFVAQETRVSTLIFRFKTRLPQFMDDFINN